MSLIRFNASASLLSLQQREMRIYRFPLLPKINPGVMNTLALCSTCSVSSSTSVQLSGDFAPEEHAYLVFVVGATQGMHNFSCQLTAVAVILRCCRHTSLALLPGQWRLPVAWHGTYRCRCCFLLSISIARSRHSRQACRYASPACCGFCSWN